MTENITAQFSCRPTGSTTAAVIDLLQQTSTMFLSNDYVLGISLDYFKAFDTVRHLNLMGKPGASNLPDHIYKWTVNYLTTEIYSPTTRKSCRC